MQQISRCSCSGAPIYPRYSIQRRGLEPSSTTLLASEHHPGTDNVTRRHQPVVCNCVGMFAFFSLFELRPPVCGLLKESKACRIRRQGVIDAASKTG